MPWTISDPSLSSPTTRESRYAGGAQLRQLEARVRQHLSSANAPSTRSTTLTALRKLARFADGAAKGRQLFLRPEVQGDISVASYNEWSMMLWAEDLLSRKSRKTGKLLAVSTVAAYVSLVKSELSAQFGFELIGTSERRLRRVLKAMRLAEPVRDRKKRRGLRGRHLRRAFKVLEPVARTHGIATADERQKIAEWASVATAREAVARGSEVCPDGPHGPTRADIEFSDSSRHGRLVTLWLRPLKKRGREAAAKVPIIFAQHDGGGNDTYAALLRMERADPVPRDQRASTPLFRHADGRRMRLSHFRKVVRGVAAACGFDPKEFGTHSPRVGGGTDVGDESPLLLQAKGRWGGDLGKIYARLTQRGLVRASRAMQRRGAKDMEEIHAAFAQPA